MKLAEKADYPAGDLRRNGSATGHCFANILEQFRWRRALQEIAARARTQRVKDAIIIVIDGEHDDLHLGKTLFNYANSFDATHAWQPYVAEENVGNVGLQTRQSFFH